MTALEIKTQLFEAVNNQVIIRHSKIKQTIADIEESLLEESKSSSGDKHETGRAMLQIDRENAGKQLAEVENLIGLVKKIDVSAISDYIRLGSLAYTNNGDYFISLSIGAVSVSNKTFICVSLNSPIGLMLSGKKKDESFLFNEKQFTVLAVK